MNLILNTPLYNKIYYDFLNDDPIINRFLPGIKKVDWLGKANLVAAQSPVYKNVKEIIAKDNADIKSPRGKKNLELLKAPDSVFIVTGQQLGLLASPLYTIYKIITAIKLADQLNRQKLGKHFIPLFWLESEDHDFAEINHFGIWDKSFKPKTIQYAGKDRDRVSIKHCQFEDSINETLNELKDNLIETEFTENLFDKLQKFYKPGNLWLEASRELLKDIFYDSGLLFFKPGDQEIKTLSVPFFKQIIDHIEQLSGCFEDNSNQLQKIGYFNQVTVIEDKTFLFIENESLQREHLYYYAEKFELRDSNLQFTKNQLFELFENNPRSVSTNVVSRPLLQSWLLPTVAYVAGPGEIAYWAQIGSMFNKVNLQMPVVYPRISATMIEPKIKRYIDKHDVDITDLPKKSNEFINGFLAQEDDDLFFEAKDRIRDILSGLTEQVSKIDPTLKNVSEKNSDKILNQIDFIESKTIKAKKQKEQILTSQLNQIHATFFPDDYPQERYLTFTYFLNKFGPEIFNTIFNNLQLENFKHQIIKL